RDYAASLVRVRSLHAWAGERIFRRSTVAVVASDLRDRRVVIVRRDSAGPPFATARSQKSGSALYCRIQCRSHSALGNHVFGPDGTASMNVFCTGLSHHVANVETRERFAGHAETECVLRRAGCSEALLLSTCNRVEVYAVSDTVI